MKLPPIVCTALAQRKIRDRIAKSGITPNGPTALQIGWSLDRGHEGGPGPMLGSIGKKYLADPSPAFICDDFHLFNGFPEEINSKYSLVVIDFADGDLIIADNSKRV